MSDLIDRNEVIKKLEQLDWQDSYLPVHFLDMVINEVPIVDAEPARKWTSVKDGSPDKDGEYLVYAWNYLWSNDHAQEITLASFYDGDWDYEIREHITHWMELPNKPDVGKEEHNHAEPR